MFLYNHATGAVAMMTHASFSATTAGDGDASGMPFLSADGAWAAFNSTATNLVSGQNDTNGTAGDDVFLFERATGTVRLVSHVPGSATTTGNHFSGEFSGLDISADGSAVVFHSVASNLVPGQTNPNGVELDVFLYERASGTVTLVSHVPGSANTPGNSSSETATISADGDVVAFQSRATNLVIGQTEGNTTYDVFVYEAQGGDQPADFDGGGDTDVSVFRPATGTWFVQGGLTTAWGTNGDIPVPGDYDGDTDVAVFRPSMGTWFVQGGLTTAWGTSGDAPLPLASAIRRAFF